MERFNSCGCRAWVLRSPDDETKHRLAANRCRSRWCVPCATEKRRTIQSNIVNACKDKDLRFLTLTLKSTDRTLSEQISRLRSSFRKLRQRRSFRGLITGGIYFIEITRNAKTKQWHPHLHVLFEGGYIDQAELKATWLDITGDSFIVDIRRLPNSGVAAGYVSKYAGKPLPSSIVNDQESFVEAIQSFEGQKTFHTFGTWRELKLSRSQADDIEWQPIMPLADCITRARAGDAECRKILLGLQRSNTHEPMDADTDDFP